MKFEAIGPDKRVKMKTWTPALVYDYPTLHMLEAGGYTFKVSNKSKTAREVTEIFHSEESSMHMLAALVGMVDDSAPFCSDVVTEVEASISEEADQYISLNETFELIDGDTYTVYWEVCRRVRDYNNMELRSAKKLTDYDAAKSLLISKSDKIQDSYWGGGHVVSDSTGIRLYRINHEKDYERAKGTDVRQ